VQQIENLWLEGANNCASAQLPSFDVEHTVVKPIKHDGSPIVLTAKFGVRVVPNHRNHGKPKLSERKMKVI
jgi:hypothetical protein